MNRPWLFAVCFGMIGPIEADSSKTHPQFLDDSFLPTGEIVILVTFPENRKPVNIY